MGESATAFAAPVYRGAAHSARSLSLVTDEDRGPLFDPHQEAGVSRPGNRERQPHEAKRHGCIRARRIQSVDTAPRQAPVESSLGPTEAGCGAR